MKKNGCIERISKNIVYGWYYFEKTQVVFAYYKDQLIGKSFALEKRIDLNNPHAHSFKIDCGTFAEDLLINIENLKIKSDVDDEIIEIYKVVKMASDIAKLSNDELKIFKRSLPDNFINILYDNEMKNFSATRLKNSLAVVAYANDANAWFPYFYSYYSGIFGESSIYIISPNPKSFVNYKLGGIVSVEGRSYCDVARSELISNVANGLKAYSEWTLVCDVDEIIVPNSVLGKSLKELIFGSTNNVIASWGLDVIQQGEPVFDFNKSIFQQRTIAVPNLALSKPHISRVPLRYSVGYHYCNIKTDESAMNGDLITLHLKFACAKIRAEVTTTVLKLDYADERTKDYSVNSVSDANVHPLIKRTGVRKIGLDAPETIEFFKQYVKNMRFDSINQIWYGQYKHADFFVKI